MSHLGPGGKEPPLPLWIFVMACVGLAIAFLASCCPAPDPKVIQAKQNEENEELYKKIKGEQACFDLSLCLGVEVNLSRNKETCLVQGVRSGDLKDSLVSVENAYAATKGCELFKLTRKKGR